MSRNSVLQKISIPWFLIIVSLLSVPMGPAAAAQADLPFRPGEKLTFVLKWEFVPAGEAVLEVRPIQMINGAEAFHFVMTAKSNSFVDVFYKVRDRIDAYTNLNVTHSVFYKKKQREGSHKRDVIVKFDWKEKKAHYSNFGKENKTISLLPGSFDPGAGDLCPDRADDRGASVQ